MLVVLRIVGFLVLLVVAGLGVVFLVTRDRRWLRFALQVLRFAVVLAVVVMLLYLFERLVLIL
jgi:hypothetical protein